MNLADLKQFLDEIGAAPKKSLSQNFLIDDNVVHKIVRSADVQKGESIIEIGPGPGALTQALLKAGAHVFAIEKDDQFAKALFRLQTSDERLHVFAGDALEFPLERIPAKKVVANLPYHITTPILERLFKAKIQSMTLMVQKEMADRLFAEPGTKEISSLTIFIRFYADLIGRFDVSASCFHPKPKVDSSVITLRLRDAPLDEPEEFFRIVRTAFQQRRKTMARSLASLSNPGQTQALLIQIGIRPDARPEMLSLDQWLLFYRAFLALSARGMKHKDFY